MRRIIVDAERCAGCRYCEMLCSFHHERKFSPSLSRVTIIKEDKYGLDYPILCHQCNLCPSVDACPTGALTKIERGIIDLNEEACIGCGLCVEACTYNAVKLDESSKPLICDLCGGDPLCVDRCPTGALTLADTEEEGEHPEEAFKEILKRWGINA